MFDLRGAIQQRDIGAVLQIYAEGLNMMTVLPDSVSTGYLWNLFYFSF